MNAEIMNKIINFEELNLEEKKEILKDTQRAGFDPSIHTVRVIFDLIESIDKLDKKSTKLSERIYILTWALVVLTLIMTISTLIIIFK